MSISKRITLSLFSFALLVTAFALPAQAAGNCQPTYGGVYGGSDCPPSNNLTIDKKVQNPQNGVFVDNMSISDIKFAPEQIVTFKIIVTNTGTDSVKNVTVKDIFPASITFSGGAGVYDAASNTLTLTLDELKADETRTFTLGGRVSKDLPTQNMISCVINQAQARVNDITVSDNAQLCMEKTAPLVTKGGLTVMPAPKVQKSPATGPEMAYLFGLLPLGSLGYFLRRKTTLDK